MSLSDTLRPRLRWAEGGRVLTVDTWQQELGITGHDARRDAIRLAWPD